MVSCALVPIIVTHKSRCLKSIENQHVTKTNKQTNKQTNKKELLLQPHPPVGQKNKIDREDKLVYRMDEMSPILFMLSEAEEFATDYLSCR